MSGRWARWLLSLARPVAPPGAGPARLTILRHHRIYADHERPLYRLGVAESVLAWQLELLARAGMAPMTVGEGLVRLASGRPGHCIALTFDDGYRDNVTRALPLLERWHARATFYLTAGLIERRVAPWWDALAHVLERTRAPRLEPPVWSGAGALPLAGPGDRVRALQRLLPAFRVPPPERDARLVELAARLGVAEPAPCELATWEETGALVRAGMEIGGHTLTHPHLTTLDGTGQRHEIAESVARIRERLAVPCDGFAYPGGDHDAVTVAIARELGLAHAVTTEPGDNRAGDSHWSLRRRGFSEGACLGPSGRFSRRLALAEIDGAFDGLRRRIAEAAA